ncbi:MAG: OOP family OmpA-OmpF porin [Bacteroidia bacterium]|jgi:OOP family OmpA-OmpF porin
MRTFFYALFFLTPFIGLAQDTLYYDTLIKTQAGDYLKVRSKSELTGLEGVYSLQSGNWHFYGATGNLLKEAAFNANAKGRTSRLDGEVIYYDELGVKVLSQTYKSGQLLSSIGYREIVVMAGITQLDIRIEYGDFVVFEHRDRFRSSKIQTSYANLRGEDELAYYLKEEERLANTHLLDTAIFWPNNPNNLVANPMMEEHPTIGTSFASINDEVESWSPASPTPDFYFSEDCKSGTGCLGFRVYSLVKDIEYLQNKLVKPLKKDSLYCFSVYVKLANQCAYTSNGLGVHFSKKPVQDLGAVIRNQPDLLLNENYLPYKTKWMLLQCRYRAQGGERYLTIGSFKPLNKISLTPVNGYSAEAYYIMDDVSLISISDSAMCRCNLDDVPASEVVYDTLSRPAEVTRIDTLKVGDRFVLENVYFDVDKHDLLPESILSLRKLFEILEEHPDMKVEIGGHTSTVGGHKHNVELSWQRAKAVKKFLVVQGIDHLRVKTDGYGPDNPIDSNETPEGRAKNRRVEVKILKL